MEILKFNLSGNFAHFKMPEINNTNLTFLQIHKTTIKGIIGAIVGLDGYNAANLFKTDVQFLTELKNLKVGIIPNANKGVFLNKIETFTNTTGHASTEEGGVLIVEEKILVNPNWDIYLDLSEINKELKDKINDYLLNNLCVYIPYLGKNHYPITIKNVEILNSEKIDNPEYCSSLFVQDNVVLDNDFLSKDDLVYGDTPFLSSFFLPINMNQELGYQDYKSFCYTNSYISKIDTSNRLFIQNDNKIIELF